MLKTLASLPLITLLLTLGVAPLPAAAAGIYSCVTTTGQNVTSDRPIPNCKGSSQRVLNRDGSTRDTLSAQPTIAERQDALARERSAARAREQAELNRQQMQNWLARYPSEQALEAERAASLQPYQAALTDTQKRLADIEGKRSALQVQADGQKKTGGKVAPHLAASIELQASMANSQRVVVQNQQLEMQRISKRYNDLLTRLRPFWSNPAAAAAPAGATGDKSP
ncbi:DUF4124 domain-containing protein [Amphibiibacter pelophylacis]|uniref:DUF4124 domain-containing protein n=1 Tax=Amphibiibacter pelophylacis TaxID=1799477 RepID=A0ACC6P4S0_9BURK